MIWVDHIGAEGATADSVGCKPYAASLGLDRKSGCTAHAYKPKEDRKVPTNINPNVRWLGSWCFYFVVYL